MKRRWRLLPLVLLLAGCGMYGDLYLEEEPPPEPAEIETEPGAEETDDDEDEDDPAGGS